MKIDDNWDVDFPDEFFLKTFGLRLDLTEEQFERWRDWFFTDLVKCENWSCSNSTNNHGKDELCGESSSYESYRSLSDELLEELKDSENLVYYPVFDPLLAHHLPDTGWMEIVDGVEKPVTIDPIPLWKDWYPKRSCLTCNGKEGVRLEKICKHKNPDKCKKSCYKSIFESWCPCMNTFMEKKGYLVNRDLEKYLKIREVFLVPNVDEMDKEMLKKSAPEPIRRYLEKIIEHGEEHERKDGFNFN